MIQMFSLTSRRQSNGPAWTFECCSEFWRYGLHKDICVNRNLFPMYVEHAAK
uniref:Uncharacterized protein n=1 Tax=Arundo donax TaxID=35708 RepID=A0A0A9ELW3_ARUDO